MVILRADSRYCCDCLFSVRTRQCAPATSFLTLRSALPHGAVTYARLSRLTDVLDYFALVSCRAIPTSKLVVIAVFLLGQALAVPTELAEAAVTDARAACAHRADTRVASVMTRARCTQLQYSRHRSPPRSKSTQCERRFCRVLQLNAAAAAHTGDGLAPTLINRNSRCTLGCVNIHINTLQPFWTAIVAACELDVGDAIGALERHLPP